MSLARSLDPFDGYQPQEGRYDELFAGPAADTVRDHWRPLVEAFGRLGTGELLDRAAATRRQLAQDGVTYNLRADDPDQVVEVAWPLDPVPMVVPDADWQTLSRGVVQRAELLNLILEDLYGPRRLLSSGQLPARVLLADPQYVRSFHGVRIPGPRQLVLVGVDFVRAPDGRWRSFGHRTQVPSGAAYALEDRRVLSRVLPDEIERADVQRLAPFLRLYRQALRNAAPAGVEDPMTVVLSSGTLSETAFEHAALAAQLGSPLVQGADLEVRDDGVYLQTVHGPTEVHVILRRVDAGFCDPLELDAGSTLGVPGLVEACRAGRVTVVNSLGAPVLENAAINARLPQLCRTLLGEDLLLDPPRSWWCGDDDGLAYVLAHLDQLIIRPVSRATLEGSVDTTELSRSALEALAQRISTWPDRYVGQERLLAGTAPCLTPEGLRPRPTVLRTFAVADADGYMVMPGGLARSLDVGVGAGAGGGTGGGDGAEFNGRSITNVDGAVSKDIWVCGGEREYQGAYWLAPHDQMVVARRSSPSARNAEDLFWTGRYAERAESTARLLRVVRDRRQEFAGGAGGPGPAAVEILLAGLSRVTGTFPPADTLAAAAGGGAGGLAGGGEGGLDLGSDELVDRLKAVVTDDADAGSVSYSLHRLLDDVDELRDQLSVDTTLVLSDLGRRLNRMGRRATVADADIDGLLSDIMQGLLSFAGLASESLVRDEVFYFIDAGRRLERAVHLANLLGATLTRERTAPTESLVIESVLMASESIITYRRRYRSHASISTVVDLLVGDADNPRSLRYQIDGLERDLEALHRQRLAATPGPYGTHPAGGSNEPVANEAIVAVQEMAALLVEFDRLAPDDRFRVDEHGERVALAALLDDLVQRLAFVSMLVSAAFFARRQPSYSVVTPVEVPTEVPTEPGVDGRDR